MKARSIGAVAAGIGVNFLAVPVDAVLHATGVFPGADMGDGLFALALSYRVALAVLGGWTTARLAPAQPMQHAWVLGWLGVVLSSLGAAAMWSLGHHWYPLSLVAISLPATWAGARLSRRN